ncbi:MAG: hypothetical protein ACYDDF_05315 [Thermoplasmatota archaeon]
MLAALDLGFTLRGAAGPGFHELNPFPALAILRAGTWVLAPLKAAAASSYLLLRRPLQGGPLFLADLTALGLEAVGAASGLVALGGWHA